MLKVIKSDLRNIAIIICLAVCGLFFGCEKDPKNNENNEEDTIETPQEDKDVYVAGYSKGETGKYVATLWKNGVSQYLTDASEHAFANSIYVSGKDVYVAGHEIQAGIPVARLWKNGIVQNLTDGVLRSEAYSVFVSGNDVYVAGYECTVERDGLTVTSDPCIAKLWKNGVATDLTDGVGIAEANSIYISGNDVYVLGYEINVVRCDPKLWKNGVLENLSGITYVHSVCVSGSDVYVAGTSDYMCASNGCGFYPKLWKNGEIENLPNGSNGGAYVHSVFASGKDVYVTGNDGDGGKLWKNGILQELSAISTPLSVYVSGNDVYIAGHSGESAKLWKNGEVQNLSSVNGDSRACCVFVK